MFIIKLKRFIFSFLNISHKYINSSEYYELHTNDGKYFWLYVDKKRNIYESDDNNYHTINDALASITKHDKFINLDTLVIDKKTNRIIN